ncbi:hypothetical protein I5Q34_02295 [Streptomyces sp. AV19]|uniref:hypothetical protein n=1 Tax=Streptomyces sp. AV19 TaxID=2793068 RepID=UPI0018FEA73E|nr:hypothetical protein [Streptomyces sp. AV19]MBH1933130.1 hypothetical protein [Streptomyces sp. AV19]MDG4531844.1 hypothetical protein [Streptomyces sp. AV19]
MSALQGLTHLAASPAVTQVHASGGPGPVLRTVVLLSLIGVPLVAYLLLRGYRRDKD